MSAVKTQENMLELLKTAVDDIRTEFKNVSCPNVEDNTTVQVSSKRLPIDGTLPKEGPIVHDWELDRKRIRFLKDDGCNMYRVS